jgi:SAM-dependent methyltransferase
VSDALKSQSGVCKDIAELVTKDGPGMQAPYPEVKTDFYRTYPFKRSNEADDRQFYQTPRLVHHLDQNAMAQVMGVYDRLLATGSRILDLMSSWVSHLPERLADCETIGLGLNAQELKTNPQLSRHVVHDLNQEPRLPFEDDTFDAVICTASIEYLIQPLEVMAEVVRVTRPGGLFVTTFSDRWFPGKEILPWSEMHPFERLGLVMNYYVKTGAFDDLHTLSIRGLPRPLDDKYISETAISDPIFGVWGRVGG